MIKIVVGSGNANKLIEYQELFPELALESLSQYPRMAEVAEDAPTFIGNAILKAKAAWLHTGQIALADDSGLEVEALGGRPGVRSARYHPGTDRDRYQKLLTEMADEGNRRARFTCAIAVAGLETRLNAETMPVQDGCIVVTGHCYGQIAQTPQGRHGFGYDPIFEVEDGRTVAQLNAAEKHAMSHRGAAARLLRPILDSIFLS